MHPPPHHRKRRGIDRTSGDVELIEIIAMLAYEDEDTVIDRMGSEVKVKPMDCGFGTMPMRNWTAGTAGPQHMPNYVQQSALVRASTVGRWFR